jgi:hypothetical protein
VNQNVGLIIGGGELDRIYLFPCQLLCLELLLVLLGEEVTVSSAFLSVCSCTCLFSFIISMIKRYLKNHSTLAHTYNIHLILSFCSHFHPLTCPSATCMTVCCNLCVCSLCCIIYHLLECPFVHLLLLVCLLFTCIICLLLTCLSVIYMYFCYLHYYCLFAAHIHLLLTSPSAIYKSLCFLLVCLPLAFICNVYMFIYLHVHPFTCRSALFTCLSALFTCPSALFTCPYTAVCYLHVFFYFAVSLSILVSIFPLVCP